jgi:H+/Cl- antiporter ClcA
MLRVLINWIFSILLVASSVGLMAALFLYMLEIVTSTRENSWVWIAFMPLAGLFIGWMYQRFEDGVKGGNNLIIKEIIVPEKQIGWKISPLVFFGTIITHLFGASAGREGTAVQIGGALGDQVASIFPDFSKFRPVFLRMGAAAGFSAVFGTPLAGVLFAYEMARTKSFSVFGFVAVVVTSFLADAVCHLTGVAHTQYEIARDPIFGWQTLGLVLTAAVLFGLTALIFSQAKRYSDGLIGNYLRSLPLKGFIGGVLLGGIILAFGLYDFAGLGVPTIEGSFFFAMPFYYFAIKLMLTVFTLGFGFKGGEATPLFFIGATLGSFLSLYLPLPISFMAAMGFVAVFAGATNTPIASTLMGCEIFGWEYWYYFLFVCVISYYLSGSLSVYSEQSKHYNKYVQWRRFLGGKQLFNKQE